MAGLLRAYMDESGTHDGSPVMCVAGYVWRKPQVSRFQKQWAATLAKANIGKPTRARYFHMKDASRPPGGEFKWWDYDDVDLLQRELIHQISKRTLVGHAVAFNEAEYNEILAGRSGMPSAYAFGCFAVLQMIRRWAEREDINQRIAYIFEAGHDDEANARQWIGEIFASPRLKAEHRHFSDSWLPKEDAPPLQCSDMLAWHTVKEHVSAHEAAIKSTPRRAFRKDFKAVLRPDLDMHRHYEKHHLQQLLDGLLEGGIPDDPIPYVPRAARKAKKSS